MAARSYIGVKQDDGTVKGVYCHNYGCLQHTGALLLVYYDTEEKAKELIELGDISLLGEKLTSSKDSPEAHSYDTPQKGVTVAYHRDRGEPLIISTFKDEAAFYAPNTVIEYHYLFKNGKWYVDKQELTKDLIAKVSIGE